MVIFDFSRFCRQLGVHWLKPLNLDLKTFDIKKEYMFICFYVYKITSFFLFFVVMLPCPDFAAVINIKSTSSLKLLTTNQTKS